MRLFYASVSIGFSVFTGLCSLHGVRRKENSLLNRGFKAILLIVIPNSYAEKIKAKVKDCRETPLLKRFGVNYWTDVVAWQMFLAILSGSLTMFFSFGIAVRFAIGFAITCWLSSLPYFLLSRKCAKRKKKITNEIPVALEIIGFVMEAGLGFDSAVKYLFEHKQGIISDSFRHANRAIEAGMLRENAYIEIGGAGSAELKTVIRSILLAEKQGRPLKQTLLNMASSFRHNQKNDLEEAANKLPATMLLPIFVFIVPPILLIYLMPAIVSFSSIGK